MTTDSWVGGTGTQQFGTEGASDANWSTGKVPNSSDDVVINPNGGDADVKATSTEDVNSIAVGSDNDELLVDGSFTVEDGSGPNTNNGLIQVSSGELTFDGGNFDSTGTIFLEGDSTTSIEFGGNTTLSGSGNIGSNPGGNGAIIQNSGPNVPTVINDENISGDYVIDGLNFINNGIIETNNSSSTIGGQVSIIPSNAVGGSFINNTGTVRADNGGGLTFASETIYNSNIIELDATTSPTALAIAGDVTIEPFAVNGNDVIALTGTFAADDAIESGTTTASLTLINETLKGAGTVGDSGLTLNNGSGSVINANNPNYELAIDAKATTNQGTMEATGGGFLEIDSLLANAGSIVASGGTVDLDTGAAGSLNQGTMQATDGQFLEINGSLVNDGTVTANGGTVIIAAAVSGSGAVDIGPNGSVWVETNTNSNITFTGEGGLYIVNSAANGGIGGSIVGGESGDVIALSEIAYSSSLTAVWTQTSASGGTLSVMNGGSTLVSLSLAGQYANGGFGIVSANNNHAEITIPNPLPPSATTAVLIMDQAGTGDYEIYDIGQNAILAAFPLAQISTSLQVVDLGAFNGSDQYDMLLRNSATGEFWLYDVGGNTNTAATDLGNVGTSWQIAGFADFSGNAGETDMLMRNGASGEFELYDIANGRLAGAHDLGNVGTSWTVAGFADFSGNAGETDMLMRNSSNGEFELYDIANNQLTGAHDLGNVGTSWNVLGFGDFSGNAGETDMLMQNSAGGDLELYDISGNQLTGAHSLGPVGSGWVVAGFGNFSGNAGEDDMLMRNSSTGEFELYDIAGNQLTGAHDLGNVGTAWQVVGFGDFSGNAGEDDMLMRDTATGEFEVYDIANNAITGAADMGNIGTSWAVAGLADPPSGGQGASNPQLVQAMASFTPAADSIDTSLPLGQSTTSPSAPSVFGAATTSSRLG